MSQTRELQGSLQEVDAREYQRPLGADVARVAMAAVTAETDESRAAQDERAHELGRMAMSREFAV